MHLSLGTNVPAEIIKKLNQKQKKNYLEWKQPKN